MHNNSLRAAKTRRSSSTRGSPIASREPRCASISTPPCRSPTSSITGRARAIALRHVGLGPLCIAGRCGLSGPRRERRLAGRSDLRHVWIPNRVAAGWTPYSDGHWAWIHPWGWTWVDNTVGVRGVPLRAAVRVSQDMMARAPVTVVPVVAPTAKSVRGHADERKGPPARALEQRVVVRTAPPAASLGFAAQQPHLAATPGRPLEESARRKLHPAATVPAAGQGPASKSGDMKKDKEKAGDKPKPSAEACVRVRTCPSPPARCADHQSHLLSVH
jgi:hypothetical protein